MGIAPRSNPYPGPRSFERGEPLFGRHVELQQLLDRLIADRVVLLVAPSGAGKTSLLNALSASLEGEDFAVLPFIRLNLEFPHELEPNQSFNRYVFSALLSMEAAHPPHEQHPLTALGSLTLNDYLEGVQSRLQPSPGQLVPPNPALVIDQLEELFTLDPYDLDSKQSFFQQLGEALQASSRYAVLTLREDFLALIEPYRRFFPNQLRSVLRMELLNAEAALQAVIRPAELAGVMFDLQAAQLLVDDLRRYTVQTPDGTLMQIAGPYVEPLQLQVVCRNLWERLAVDADTITLDDVSTTGDIDSSLMVYYDDTIASAARQADVTERLVRRWIDTRLITPQGTRGQVLLGAGETEGLPNPVIDSLVNAHLLRAERRRGLTWLELAQDRLVQPIRRTNEAWFQTHLSLLQRQAALWEQENRPDHLLLRQAGLEEASRWAGEHPDELSASEMDFLRACQALAERENVLRRAQEAARLRRWLVAVSLLAALALGFAVLSFFASRRANEQQRQALANAATATIAQGQALFQAATATVAQGQALSQAATATVAQGQAEQQARRARVGELVVKARARFDIWPEESLLVGSEALRISLEANEPTRIEAEQLIRDSLEAVTGEPVLDPGVGLDIKRFSSSGNWMAATTFDDNRLLLWQLFDPDSQRWPLTLDTQSSPVSNLLFSRDERWLIGASFDGKIRLWELSDAIASAPSLVLEGHEENENTYIVLAISEDGRWLASLSGDTTLRLWDLQAADPNSNSKLLSGQTCSTNSTPTLFLMSAAGGVIACQASVGIEVWFIQDGQPVKLTQLPFKTASALAISRDGRWLASADFNKLIAVWDLQANDITASARLLGGHENFISSLAFSQDGQLLASGSDDGSIRIWSYQADDPAENARVLRSAAGPVTGLQFNIDGQILLSVGSQANYWFLAGSDPLAPGNTYNTQASSAKEFATSPHLDWYLGQASDKLIRLWSAETSVSAMPYRLGWLSEAVRAMSFSADGRLFTAALVNGEIRQWNVSQDTRPAALDTRIFDQEATAIAISSSNRWLASGNAAGQIQVWDLQSKELRKPSYEWGDNTSEITLLTFSPDERWLVWASEDGKLFIWERVAGQPGSQPIELADIGFKINTLLVSPDSRWLAMAGADANIYTWDLTAVQPETTGVVLAGHSNSVTSLAFDRDSHLLASSSADHSIRLWNTQDFSQAPLTLSGHVKEVHYVAVSPDGRWLASGGADIQLKVWDLRTPGQVTPVWSTAQRIQSLNKFVFSEDSRWLILPNFPGIRMFDLASPRQQLNSLVIGGRFTASSLLPSPDGRWLASTYARYVNLWPMQTDLLLKLACQSAGGNLSQSEWGQYFPGEAYRRTCPQWPEGE
jgi:WD40 repeat protein